MVKQELFKKLMSYAKWISSMAIHPGNNEYFIFMSDIFLCLFNFDDMLKFSTSCSFKSLEFKIWHQIKSSLTKKKNV